MKRILVLLLLAMLSSFAAFAQKTFDARYNEAVEYYTQKQFDKAIKVLETAKKTSGVTKAQVAQATRLIKQCQASKQKLADLNLSKESIAFPGIGQKDSVFVTAGKSWEVTSFPEWCKTWNDAGTIYLDAQPNETNESRKGLIEVTMAKERTAYILVTQDKKLNINCPVRIQTVPGRAVIYVDKNPGMLTENFVLGEGRHKVVIEKSGFVRKDTTLVVTPENAEGMTCLVKLTPTFSTITVQIEPAEGFSFKSPATLDVSGNEIDLNPEVVKSFNVDQELSYYNLYEDNLIPLHPGQYMVKAGCPGFKPSAKSITVERGCNEVVKFVLEPVCGTLTVSDAENAAGAQVFVDGKEVGTVPVSDLALMIGNHKVKVVKEGLISEAEEYQVVINEDQSTALNVSMQPCSIYNLTSEPLYCKVTLDGKPVGSTPIKLVLLDGKHEVRLEKTGYYPLTKYIITDFSAPSHDLPLELERAYPLTISCDKDSLGVRITRSGGKEIFVSPNKSKTPCEVYLPLSKKPYRIELLRSDRRKAFRGNLYFSDPRHDHKQILTWANNPIILSGQWYAIPPDPALQFSNMNKSYSRLADVNLVKFKLFPGFSTSLAKAALFWEQGGSIIYPSNSSGKMGLTPGDDGYKDIRLIPAITLLFLNDEFRMGGAITQNIDINMLATYAWYPDISSLVTFTHMSGHDVFAGLELNSRIPVFNISVRAGIQAFYGKANIARPNAVDGNDIENKYVFEDYKIPIQRMQFVLGIGFSLGGTEARGQNIVRIF